MQESKKTFESGQSLIIFPEDSSKGYFDELTSFYGGFAVFANMYYKKGIDVPIYVSYFKKQERIYVIDKPVRYSELAKDGKTKEEIADVLRLRCNELGKMTFDEKEMEELKKVQEQKFKEWKKASKQKAKAEKKMKK